MTITADVATLNVHLPAGMVGFPETRDYVLSELENGVYEMLSANDDSFGFVVIEPDSYFPDYAPVIDGLTAQRLALSASDDALMLVVVNMGAEGESPVANLLAPVVVNKHTRTATQVVLADQDWPLRASIPLG